MKNMKRMLGFIMAVMMILAMIPAVMADDVVSATKEVTVTYAEYLNDSNIIAKKTITVDADETSAFVVAEAAGVPAGCTIANCSSTLKADATEGQWVIAYCKLPEMKDIPVTFIDYYDHSIEVATTTVTVVAEEDDIWVILDMVDTPEGYTEANYSSVLYDNANEGQYIIVYCYQPEPETKTIPVTFIDYYDHSIEVATTTVTVDTKEDDMLVIADLIELPEGYVVANYSSVLYDNANEGQYIIVYCYQPEPEEPAINEIVTVTFQKTTTTTKWFGFGKCEPKVELFGDSPYELTADSEALTTPDAKAAEHFVLDYWQLVGTDITLPAGEYTFDDLVDLVEGVETTDEETGVITCTHTLVFEPVYQQVTKDVCITLTHVLNPLKSTIIVMEDIDVDQDTVNFNDIVLPDGYYCIYTTVEGVWDGEIPLTKTLDSTKDTAFVMVVTK